MKLSVTPAAVKCFTEEWGYNPGDCVRLFVRYAGGGAEPFTFGIKKGKPEDIGVSTNEKNITYYIEETDLWFLDNHDLTIDCKHEEIVFKMNE